MSERALCVVCGAPVAEGRHSLWLGSFCRGLPWGRPADLPDGATEALAGPTPMWTLVRHF